MATAQQENQIYNEQNFRPAAAWTLLALISTASLCLPQLQQQRLEILSLTIISYLAGAALFASLHLPPVDDNQLTKK